MGVVGHYDKGWAWVVLGGGKIAGSRVDFCNTIKTVEI